MKINKAKLLVGTLAVVATAATVGSISGTVAWFQYSTRSTVAYKGAAAHCSESLQIRINAGNESTYPWKQDLTSTEIGTYLGTIRSTPANTLHPVTSGALEQGKVATDLYKNPIYQYPDMSDWGTATATADYVVIPLQLRVLDLNGAAPASATYLAKKIYVTDVTIAADVANGSGMYDFSSAVRVGVSAAQAGSSLAPYATFSTANASDAATGIAVSGKLDLNNDGYADREAGYDFQTGVRPEVTYGESGVAKSTSNTQLATTATASDVGVANDTDPYTIAGKEIGSTAADKVLNVEVKIYLEGWAQISDYTANVDGTADTPMKTIWDVAKSNGALFDVGIRFSAEAHNATGE